MKIYVLTVLTFLFTVLRRDPKITDSGYVKDGAAEKNLLISQPAPMQNKQDAIVGKWMTTEENLLVEIYKWNNQFKAKVLWFKDHGDKNKPYDSWLDTKNPDKSMRNRKIAGMEILHGLMYNSKEDRWEDGKIYD